MCGRYTQTAALDVLAERFGVTLTEDDNEALVARYNVAPSQMVPIIVEARQGRRIVLARWGFRPGWASSSGLAPINARAETLVSSPMFRDAVSRFRCLVPADGFYEWQARPGQRRRQPWLLRLRDGGLFGFAGLWTPGDAEKGEPPTCTIITTRPNEVARPLHDRMPVILLPEREGPWLDRATRDATQVVPFLEPLPAERMEAYPVSSSVSSPQNDGPSLVERVVPEDPAPPDRQGTLL
jgi:putative SOS response-associated peptidase YedK